MSYFLLDLPEGCFAGTGNGILKATERQHFDDAAQLLAQVRDMVAEQQSLLEQARQNAYDAALAEARAMLTDGLAQNAEDFARQIAAIETRLSASVAQAALAAAQSIIDDLPKPVVTEHIAAKLLRSYGSDGPISLCVSPANAEYLSGKLDMPSSVSIIADPAFGDTDCRLLDGKRTIVADLSVQLSAIAEKWGIAAAPMAEEEE
ncbi:hypothetical protein ACFOWX_11705 [Sphingorhabdus arenilitoris]|uniref:Flagellar assembly protein FliH/Type III secretion system HrpE domain-containing protein n=1 Tax=Sphingorhabdus arenilitoris TaxID=1490041 RepID=A0ABV8RKR4_9SPHN